MRVSTLTFTPETGWNSCGALVAQPDIVLWFAAPRLARAPEIYEALRARFPNALIAGCSTGGEIHNDEVLDGTAVAAAVTFERAKVRGFKSTVTAGMDVSSSGREIAAAYHATGAYDAMSAAMATHNSGKGAR